MNDQWSEDILNIAQEIPDFSSRILLTYIQLWQLEIWLRHMVYIELKARDGDNWSNNVQNADSPRKADSRLTHMPTPESEPLSYAGFSELRRLISENCGKLGTVTNGMKISVNVL